MTADAAVAAGRMAAEALMGDSFDAHALEWTTVDGLEQESWVLQYATRGRVVGRSRDADTGARTVKVGGVERVVVEGGLHIPVSAGLPARGWRFTCTAVGAGSDPSLVGRVFEVVEVPAKSFATARRLDVAEV